MTEWIVKTDTPLNEDEQLNNAQLVANHFAATWAPEAICALCGNMSHESWINPDVWEFGYNHSLDRGFGLVQWTPASKYIDWATAAGLDWHTGDSQLSRIDYEATEDIQWIANGHNKRYGKESKYDFSFADFRINAPNLTIPELTEAFMWNYEGPNYTAGSNSLPDRQAFAVLAGNTLSFEGGPIGDPGTGKDSNVIYHLWLSHALPNGIGGIQT
jgi:hypothetical protein